ncbi:MAG: hypothetical protein COB66_04525 [Coxiella sp. (in: Bacteria)]|nr:MAG: hypothetical protein COB66_04525 [Coxiella sp. (in: g-proteobacteria)]
MPNDSKFPDFISTYQKVLLSDWSTLAKLIFKHSTKLKDGGYNEEDFNASPTNVLSELQILDAVQGPYSAFFLDKIKAFTVIARLRMAANIDAQDSLKDNITHLDKDLVLDKEQVERFPTDEITKIQEALDALVVSHNQQWEGQLFFWQMSITGSLNNNGLATTELESDEFSAPEPISELLARYDGVNITPPKVDYPLSFADYFRLKAYLLILSALSRQHLPHDAKQIEKFMKLLKQPLNEIEKGEKQLRKQQQTETDVVIDQINFASLTKKKS